MKILPILFTTFLLVESALTASAFELSNLDDESEVGGVLTGSGTDVHVIDADSSNPDEHPLNEVSTSQQKIVQSNPFRDQANVILPLKTDKFFTFQEVWAGLEPHLFPENREKFENTLLFFFNKMPLQASSPGGRTNFREPVHNAKFVNGGWQCFLGKILEAEDRSRPEEQSDALQGLLAMHKNMFARITQFYEEKAKQTWDDAMRLRALSEEVQEAYPCENCIRVERAEYSLDLSKIDA